jgi:hypothetical protein
MTFQEFGMVRKNPQFPDAILLITECKESAPPPNSPERITISGKPGAKVTYDTIKEHDEGNNINFSQ